MPIGRTWRVLLRETREVRNYQALARTVTVYPRPAEGARRYFLQRGSYPCVWPIRTPAGVVSPTLYSPHDMLTVNEIFCRRDYPAGPETRVVVDLGSNIGLSALWFLTRDPGVRCYLYEPVPRNLARLRANLRGLEDRYQLDEAAVADRAGSVSFGVEPSGRYGGIGLELAENITVRCRDVNEVLAGVLERESRIDVLKVDTEGLEVLTVAAIRPALLDRIHAIYLETEKPVALHTDRFHNRYANMTLQLTKPDAGTAGAG